jgi:hypothetical protein
MYLTKKSGKYHCRFRLGGKHYSICTGESDARAAAVVARKLHRAARAGDLCTASGRTPSHADIIAEYERYAAARALSRDLAASTARANIAAYRRYLTLTKTPESAPITTLTREHAAAYRAAQTSGLTPEAIARAAQRINGPLRHARAIYTRATLDHYTRAGHTLPHDTLTGWLTAPLLPATTPPFTPPATADIAALDTATAILWDSGDPHDHALATAIFLHRCFGLRNKEVLHARADWIETDPDGTPCLVIRARSDFTPKRHGETETHLRADPSIQPRLSTILADARAVAPDAHLVYPGAARTPNKSERTPHGLIYRRLSRFVRDHLRISGRGKTTYQLRKLYGSEILTATGSIEIAAASLRNSPTVARAHYARLLRPLHSIPLHSPASAPDANIIPFTAPPLPETHPARTPYNFTHPQDLPQTPT